MRRELGWVALVVILTYELRTDLLGVLDPAYKDAFQQDSDALVVNRLQQAGGSALGPLVMPDGTPYLSQLGLQGSVMALLSPGPDLLSAYRWTTAFLLAAVLVLAARAMAERVSNGAGLCLLVLLTLSTWLNAFAVSLYWQVWTLLLPTLLALLLWPWSRRRAPWAGYALIAAAVFLKALCGYEFITTVILGATAAVCFHELHGRVDARLLRVAALATAAGIAGFLAGMLLHVVQLEVIYGNATAIQDRGGVRTFSPGDLGPQVADIRPVSGPVVSWLLDVSEPLGIWVHRMAGYVMDPAVASPGGAGFGPAQHLPVWFFAGAYLLLVWRMLRPSTRPRRAVPECEADLERRLALGAGVGLVGAMSWLVLAYGHMVNHPHIDAIVFYVPFLPFCFALLVVRSRRELLLLRDRG